MVSIGSVTQRTILAKNGLQTLSICSVPVSEIDFDVSDPLGSTAKVLGVPRSLLVTAREYSEVVGRVSHPIFTEAVSRPGFEVQNSDVFVDFGLAFNERGDRSRFALADRLYGPRFWLLDQLAYQIGMATQELPPEKARLIADLLLARASRRLETYGATARSIEDFFVTALRQDVPLANSPEVRGMRLEDLLKNPRLFCMTPLALGGASGTTKLVGGEHVAALLSVGTGTALSLILIGGWWASTQLFSAIERSRSNSPDGDTD